MEHSLKISHIKVVSYRKKEGKTNLYKPNYNVGK